MIKRYLQISLGLMLIFFMVSNPKEVFEAASLGLNAWWKMVFPALLPFFIGSELLMGFGVVSFMGVLLEPIMRPLFNLPGSASFVIAMGYTSGSPIGAVITAKLRKEKALSKEEGERVMSFSNNASPLFMLAAVSVGMFNNPSIGIILAGSHYLANLVIGLGLGFITKNKKLPPSYPRGGLLKRAFRELNQAYRSNPKPLGYFIGEAIKKSVNTLLIIGGFVIFFSVLIKILSIIGVIKIISSLFALILSPLGFNISTINALSSGLFEITLGIKMVSEATAPLMHQVIATSIILGWCGLAVHAQVATLIAETDLNMTLFMICRAIQGILAGIFSWFLFVIFKPSSNSSTPAFGAFGDFLSSEGSLSWLTILKNYTLLFLIAVTTMIGIGLIYQLITGIKLVRFKDK